MKTKEVFEYYNSDILEYYKVDKIDISNIKEHFNIYFEILQGVNIKKYFKDFPEFFELPASTKYHGCFKGGLATHTYYVVNEAIAMYERYCKSCKDFKIQPKVTLNSIIKVAMLHDIGKIGQLDSDDNLIPSYVYNNEESKWDYNKDIKLKMEHELQSLYFCNLYNIKLTLEETMVIAHHAGAYNSSHQYINDSQSVLQIIIHQADNYCCKVLNI